MSANEYNTKNVDMSIKEQYMSLSALNPWIKHNSAPRGYMNMMQLAQIAVLLKPEPRLTLCGLEHQLADNTFKIVVTDTIIVRNIVVSDIDLPLEDSSLITIIGEVIETGRIDVYEIPIYFSMHQYFGFRYVRNMELIQSLVKGAQLLEGTVLAESPGVVDGLYSYGINTPTLLATDPATGQDGAIISKSLAKKMRYNIYISGSFEYGADKWPQNIYGTIDKYKGFPEVGESVNEEGIFAVVRDFDKDVTPGIMSKKDTMEWNPIFDRVYFVKPKDELRDENDSIVNNKVVSLRIVNSKKSKREPLFNNEQASRVANKNLDYYKGIISSYEKIARKDKIVSPELQRLVVEAYNLVNPEKEKIVYKFKNDPIDLYRVEYVIEYTVEPGIGSKVSDAHGAKGIIVDVRDDDKMPYDQYGNRVELIMDPTSIPSRMNSGRSYESYFGAASRNAKRVILGELGKPIDELPDSEINRGYDLYLRYIKHFGTEQYDEHKDLPFEAKFEILKDIEENELYQFYKLSTKKPAHEIVNDLEKDDLFFVPREPIYIDGKLTVNPITVGNLYLMLLSKTADGYLASASANLNHYGIPVRVNNSVKTGLPYINNPTKVTSETEGRAWRSYSKSPILALEYKHRASCTNTHSAIYHKVLTSKNPTNIDVAVDRNKVPYGDDSALKLLKGIINPIGIDFRYVRGKL